MPFTKVKVETVYEVTGEAPMPASGGFSITPMLAVVTQQEGQEVEILVKGMFGKRHGTARHGRYGDPITKDSPKWIRQLEAIHS